MLTYKKILLLLIGMLSVTPLFAAMPYVGQQLRDIKALSAQDIYGLQQGSGMGMAKAAELNHYPGPKHVLELTTALRLTSKQQEQTQSVFAAMNKEAVRLGNKLLRLERELDKLFASKSISPASLKQLTDEIGQTRGQLRRVHLQAHLQQREILTPVQIASYDKLRGYANGNQQHHDHKH